MATNDAVAVGLVEGVLKSWQMGVDRGAKLFGRSGDEELEREIAPGKNRLIYIYGHLVAIHDSLYPTLRLGTRLHPDWDELFLKGADRTVSLPPAAEVREAWNVVHERLRVGMAGLSAEEWLERHALVSEEDFAKEPHRNRLAVLLSRSGHLAYHLGQVVLVK
jgi:hypothetical protein